MAKAYRVPEGFDPPEFSTYFNGSRFDADGYKRAERDYVERLAALARKNGTDPALGQEIHFPRGDGYARYMVWTTKPLALLHLPLGDAWSVEDALIRGLRLSDVHKQISQREQLRKLFSKP